MTTKGYRRKRQKEMRRERRMSFGSWYHHLWVWDFADFLLRLRDPELGHQRIVKNL